MKKIIKYSKNWKDKLFIDSEKIEELNITELNKELPVDITFSDELTYSITPKTLKKITFTKDLLDPIFTEEYAFKDNSVKRFGLNVNSQVCKQMVQEHNETLKKIPFDTKSIITSKSEKAKIQAINECSIASKDLLSKLEFTLVNDAIQHLKDIGINSKAVLVDIFERDADNKIQIKSDVPQSHTVVLYNQAGRYLVIDPSNAEFSHILTGANENIRVCFSSKSLQIYKPNGNTGSQLDEWRDCVDIATKIAFALQINQDNIQINIIKNQGDYAEVIDFNSLKESISLKDITNQRELYPSLPKILETNHVRAKQSSDLSESKFTTLYLKKLNKSMLGIDEKLENSGIEPYHLKAHYQEQHLSHIKAPKNHSDYITHIKQYVISLDKEITFMEKNNSYIQEQEELLIGEISKQYGEEL